jgi:hypothetical protein
MGSGPFPALLWSFPPSATFTNFPAPDCWVVLLLLLACVVVYSSHGRWVFPPSCGVFLSPPLSQAFPLLVAGCAPLRPLEPSSLPSLFIYSFRKDSPPPIFGAQCAPPSFPFVFIALIAYYSVSLFSPGGGPSVQGYGALALGCLWEYHGIAKLTLSGCSQAVWARVTGGPRALLVSPFNVKWRCSALAGGVEGSKFCLFLVVLPARCVSSVSPIFHHRRHAFCFLPLAAILEFSELHNFKK